MNRSQKKKATAEDIQKAVDALKGIHHKSNIFPLVWVDEETYKELTKENKPMTTSKYRVLKNSRVATKTIFSSYERARQWVRKQIRKNMTPQNYIEIAWDNTQSGMPLWDTTSRNPTSHSAVGYSIRKVA